MYIRGAVPGLPTAPLALGNSLGQGRPATSPYKAVPPAGCGRVAEWLWGGGRRGSTHRRSRRPSAVLGHCLQILTSMTSQHCNIDENTMSCWLFIHSCNKLDFMV